MEFALGVLCWTPAEFWGSTPLELTSAYVGYCRREGLGRWQADSAGINADTAEELLQTLEAHKRVHGDSHLKRNNLTKVQRRELKNAIRAGVRGGLVDVGPSH